MTSIVVRRQRDCAIDISAGLDVDVVAGTIRRKLGYPFYGPFFTWLPAMTVTYVAGWGIAAPAAFNTVARIILQYFWDTQHGPSAAAADGRPGPDGDHARVRVSRSPTEAAQLLEGSAGGVPFMLRRHTS